MKRPALIFFVAIFVPSLLLGWLALRTAGEQRIVLERQTAELFQAETDATAARMRRLTEDRQAAFAAAIRELVAAQGAPALAEDLSRRLAALWTGGGIPFAVSPQGALVSPTVASARDNPEASRFLRDNSLFLGNAAAEEIYQAPVPTLARQEVKQEEKKRSASSDAAKGWPDVPPPAAKSRAAVQQYNRNVLPQKSAPEAQVILPSKLAPELSDFQTAVRGSAQGILARFVQDDLQVLFWTRPDPGDEWLFGLMLGPAELRTLAAETLSGGPLPDNVWMAVLNDRARPVARNPEDFERDWKRPFVATEIGEVLPHWEVALYLADPARLTDSARLVSFTLILLITLALAAILAGGYFVAADTRRQLALAQKKADFVSNVSHELKTPLTSIRMFADLLAEGRVAGPEKRDKYLRIISGESERLTRLVNNVLDFSRLERHRKFYEMRETDLFSLFERIWNGEEARLREAGFSTSWSAKPGPYRVVCDADAVAQIFVNLISNAEKYATRRREVEAETRMDGETFVAEIRDRGAGVPEGLEEKIFEAFFRADDSLASGVQGSGLGLTLARRIARDHGGDVTCQARASGGAIFTVRLPAKPPVHP